MMLQPPYKWKDYSNVFNDWDYTTELHKEREIILFGTFVMLYLLRFLVHIFAVKQFSHSV